MKQAAYAIREMRPSEYPLLRGFTYGAIFQRDGEAPLPFDVVDEPGLMIYHCDFGKKDDLCLVAEASGGAVGAAWARILSGEPRGYGNVDAETPELSIAVLGEYRGAGIGAALMRAMLAHLAERGYKQVSLSVQRENRAARLYERLGFRVARESDGEWIMIHPF